MRESTPSFHFFEKNFPAPNGFFPANRPNKYKTPARPDFTGMGGRVE